jgi:hypothetical protein
LLLLSLLILGISSNLEEDWMERVEIVRVGILTTTSIGGAFYFMARSFSPLLSKGIFVRLNFLRTGSISLKASCNYSRVLAPVNTILPLPKINITTLGSASR